MHRVEAVEQDLALVGEMPEERPLGQSGPHGDLRHRGLVESPLGVERQRYLRQPAARVRLPSTHSAIIRNDSDRHR